MHHHNLAGKSLLAALSPGRDKPSRNDALVRRPCSRPSNTGNLFHGFLVLKTLEGAILAAGDLVQVAHGNRVTSRLTFHFRDGSLDDEITVFTQRATFRLISNHHIQRGPSFPKPLDMSIDAISDQVTSRDKDGKTIQTHLDLPADIANGLPLVLLLNLDPCGPSNPSLHDRAYRKASSDSSSRRRGGRRPVTIGGIRLKATNYRIKIELGGLTGVVAPMIGKQPSDIHVWIFGGEAPSFVKEESQFYEGGPVWRVELTSPVFAAPSPPANN